MRNLPLSVCLRTSAKCICSSPTSSGWSLVEIEHLQLQKSFTFTHTDHALARCSSLWALCLAVAVCHKQRTSEGSCFPVQRTVARLRKKTQQCKIVNLKTYKTQFGTVLVWICWVFILKSLVHRLLKTCNLSTQFHFPMKQMSSETPHFKPCATGPSCWHIGNLSTSEVWTPHSTLAFLGDPRAGTEPPSPQPGRSDKDESAWKALKALCSCHQRTLQPQCTFRGLEPGLTTTSYHFWLGLNVLTYATNSSNHTVYAAVRIWTTPVS